MIAIRSYEFEGGILHLELDAVQNMPNDEVAELYGSGELLAVRDGEMPAKQFFALEDFRDL